MRGSRVSYRAALTVWGVTVYPRVCGGAFTTWRESVQARCRGLSPRVRGSPLRSGRSSVDAHDGSIPACAGEPPAGRYINRRRGRGSIPACAGEPCSCWRVSRDRNRRVYPRVCGGATLRLFDVGHSWSGGSIPACAGEPSPCTCTSRPPLEGSIPACAGEPYLGAHPLPSSAIEGLSPRVRGSLACVDLGVSSPGRVYPRVCGGAAKSAHEKLDRDNAGSIPACAGEPLQQ